MSLYYSKSHITTETQINKALRELEAMCQKYNNDYFHDERLLGYLLNEKFLRQLLHEAIAKVVYWRCGDTKITFI